MVEDKLNLILDKLSKIETEIRTLKSGQQEINQIVSAIRSNHEMFNARLEGLENGIKDLNSNIGDHISSNNKAIRYLNRRMSDLELEFQKLK